MLTPGDMLSPGHKNSCLNHHLAGGILGETFHIYSISIPTISLSLELV